jgi:hypothetical protein
MRPDLPCILRLHIENRSGLAPGRFLRAGRLDRLRELAMRRSSIVTKIALGSTILGAGSLGAAVTATDAEARLDLYVDKSAQQISVIHNGALLYVWPVSTGRDRHSTPSGVYTPERLERSWFSRAYYNSPMPHAIFFHSGYAIHGSYDISKLGGPASHGCVRLHPHNAAQLFSMVERAGPNHTAIFVGGDQRRASLRYGNFDDPAAPPYRRGDGIARGVYPPDAPVMPPPRPGTDRYVGDRYVADRYGDAASAYPPGPPPPSGPRVSPYYPPPPVIDGRGAYPGGPDTPRYSEGDRYGDGRVAPRSPGAGPYGDVDGHYTAGRDATRDPRLPDYYADPQVGGRAAARDPRVPPDYSVDPYVDARGVPYGPGVPSYYPSDRRADGRAAYPQPEFSPRETAPREFSPREFSPRESAPRPPYNTVDRYADGPARQHGDQLTMRGSYPPNYPPNHPPSQPATRPGGAAERSLLNGLRPATAAAMVKPKPESRPEPKLEPRPGRLAGPPPGRRVTAGEAAKAPVPSLPAPAAPAPQPAAAAAPPAPAARVEPPQPQQERPQPQIGYRVLPRSYWAGASWRWRIKRDEDGSPRDPR